MIDLARGEGVRQLCFELHPANCVYNPSSFQRLRTALGPVVAANLDPSHFFFQGMDPLAVIRSLGDAIGYVHAKDARVEPHNLSVQGSLDLQPGKPVRDLVWAYRTLGYGHGVQFWADFVSALRTVGYDGVLSIEHEDPLMDSEEAIGRAVALSETNGFLPSAFRLSGRTARILNHLSPAVAVRHRQFVQPCVFFLDGPPTRCYTRPKSIKSRKPDSRRRSRFDLASAACCPRRVCNRKLTFSHRKRSAAPKIKGLLAG